MRSNNKINKLLVVSPHHDDESIGAGGTIAKFCKSGVNVFLLVVFAGDSGLPHKTIDEAINIREQELISASKILGINDVSFLRCLDRREMNHTELVNKIIPFFRKIEPDVLLFPHIEEQDKEHKLVSNCAVEAAWLASTDVFPELGVACPPIKTLLGYEVWTPIKKPQLYVNISDFIEKKTNAIKSHNSQTSITKWGEASKGLSAYRGITSGVGKYAEAFSIYSLSSEFFFNKENNVY